uniref:Uncharacterized protein n=1 Tax=Ananas comosus var. bracteatus TaxID=296719 RepID=A0A6V7P4V4_ANACO|nr:unnamed protein product [Ananas comosus var. bracteatus]
MDPSGHFLMLIPVDGTSLLLGGRTHWEPWSWFSPHVVLGCYRFTLERRAGARRGRSSVVSALPSRPEIATLSAVQGKPCPFGDLLAAPRPGQIGGWSRVVTSSVTKSEEALKNPNCISPVWAVFAQRNRSLPARDRSLPARDRSLVSNSKNQRSGTGLSPRGTGCLAGCATLFTGDRSLLSGTGPRE